MVKCPSCGAEVAESAVSCSKCGATLGSARDASGGFASRGIPFRTSPWSSLAYVPLAWIAVIFVSKGWVFLLVFAPHYLLLAAGGTVILGFVIYLVIEILAGLARLTGSLTFLRLLAACGILSFALGLAYGDITQSRPVGHGLLLEEYAETLLAYAALLYLAATLWWLIYRSTGKAGEVSWMGRVAALLLAVAPFALYGIAQTSRLHDAVATGDLEKVQRALKPWKSVNATGRTGQTPLGVALARNHREIGEFLLSRGATIQLQVNANRNIDHFAQAVREGRTEFIALFLRHGGTLDLSSALQEVMSAPRARPDRLRTLELLLKHGASPGQQDRGGQLLAERALYARPHWDAPMLEVLLANGFPVQARNAHKHTLLYIAARLRNLDAVRMLLEHGADANDGGVECGGSGGCSGSFRTALHEAINLDSTTSQPERGREIAELLIKHGAKVDVADPQGATPLMVALYARNLIGVQALIDAGADPRLGLRGRTPLDMAERIEDGRFREQLARADLQRLDRLRAQRASTQSPSPTYGAGVIRFGEPAPVRPRRP